MVTCWSVLIWSGGVSTGLPTQSPDHLPWPQVGEHSCLVAGGTSLRGLRHSNSRQVGRLRRQSSCSAVRHEGFCWDAAVHGARDYSAQWRGALHWEGCHDEFTAAAAAASVVVVVDLAVHWVTWTTAEHWQLSESTTLVSKRTCYLSRGTLGVYTERVHLVGVYTGRTGWVPCLCPDHPPAVCWRNGLCTLWCQHHNFIIAICWTNRLILLGFCGVLDLVGSSLTWGHIKIILFVIDGWWMDCFDHCLDVCIACHRLRWIASRSGCLSMSCWCWRFRMKAVRLSQAATSTSVATYWVAADPHSPPRFNIIVLLTFHCSK